MTVNYWSLLVASYVMQQSPCSVGVTDGGQEKRGYSVDIVIEGTPIRDKN